MESDLKELILEITDPAVHPLIKVNMEHRTTLYGTKNTKHSSNTTGKKLPKRKDPNVLLSLRRGIKMNIPRKLLKYDEMLSLNDFWNDYVISLLDLNDGDVFPQPLSKEYKTFTRALAKIDFHGAIIKIEMSHCITHVGVIGIVIRELTNVFQILSKDNCLRTISKKCTFTVYIKNIPFTVLGTHLRNKIVRRARQKPKRYIQA